MSSRALVIGNNTADLVFSTRSPAAPDEKIQATSLRAYGGGQAANVAAALPGLGVPAWYFGAFGGDALGALSRRSLEEARVDTDGCLEIAGCPQHTAAIVADQEGGTRFIVMHKDARLRLDDHPAGAIRLDDVALLYLDGHEPGLGRRVAERALALGIPIVADAEVDTPEIRALLPLVSVLIAPARVLCALAGAADEREATARLVTRGPAIAVATMGAEGAWGHHAGAGPIRVPARPARVTDTTGAGDAFHAGYIAAALRGADFRSSLEYAALVAAEKCQVPGPRLDAATLSRLRGALPEAAPASAPSALPGARRAAAGAPRIEGAP